MQIAGDCTNLGHIRPGPGLADGDRALRPAVLSPSVIGGYSQARLLCGLRNHPPSSGTRGAPSQGETRNLKVAKGFGFSLEQLVCPLVDF